MPEGIAVEYSIEVVWEGGRRYRGGPADGPTHVVDGNREAAPSPVDSVIVALASCSAIDVVDILEKRRTPAAALSVSARFSRAPTPPRRITDAHLTFRVATDSPREHVERAIVLSMEKYCSVANSLAGDTRLSWELALTPAAEAGSIDAPGPPASASTEPTGSSSSTGSTESTGSTGSTGSSSSTGSAGSAGGAA
jgi:putative redox protein